MVMKNTEHESKVIARFFISLVNLKIITERDAIKQLGVSNNILNEFYRALPPLNRFWGLRG